MPTVLVFHEVDDIEKWQSSPKREEFFGSRGITVRTFTDQQDTTRVGLILEVPDVSALGEAMETDDAAAAMEHDGVRPETLVSDRDCRDRLVANAIERLTDPVGAKGSFARGSRAPAARLRLPAYRGGSLP